MLWPVEYSFSTVCLCKRTAQGCIHRCGVASSSCFSHVSPLMYGEYTLLGDRVGTNSLYSYTFQICRPGGRRFSSLLVQCQVLRDGCPPVRSRLFPVWRLACSSHFLCSITHLTSQSLEKAHQSLKYSKSSKVLVFFNLRQPRLSKFRIHHQEQILELD